MGTTKQVGTWGSNTLMGYSIPKYGNTYYRIIEANKAAKRLGISYGKYMAGLWEKHDRAPIEFGNFTKYAKPSNKAQQKKAIKLLEGNDAAEYIRKLKVKAGTYEEPVATANVRSGAEKEKAILLNTEWSDAVKKLRENPEKVKNIKMVGKGKERKRPYDTNRNNSVMHFNFNSNIFLRFNDGVKEE